MILFILNIPIVDWSANSFLLFYAALFFPFLFWTAVRKRKAVQAFELEKPIATLTDPLEMAFLAGGASRFAEVSVARLALYQSIRLKKKTFGADRLIANTLAPENNSYAESDFFQKISDKSARGLAIPDEVHFALAEELQKVELSLARKGLRPTQIEKQKIGQRASLPLLFLMSLGVLRLTLGIIRGEGAELILIFLILSVICMLIVMHTKHLSKAGQDQLNTLRTTSLSHGAYDKSEAMIPLALFGIKVIPDHPVLCEIDPLLTKSLEKIANSSSGGSDSSSGCSSGCGGGCGGCGD